MLKPNLIIIESEAIPKPTMKTVGGKQTPMEFNDWCAYISKLNNPTNK